MHEIQKPLEYKRKGSIIFPYRPSMASKREDQNPPINEESSNVSDTSYDQSVSLSGISPTVKRGEKQVGNNSQQVKTPEESVSLTSESVKIKKNKELPPNLNGQVNNRFNLDQFKNQLPTQFNAEEKDQNQRDLVKEGSVTVKKSNTTLPKPNALFSLDQFKNQLASQFNAGLKDQKQGDQMKQDSTTPNKSLQNGASRKRADSLPKKLSLLEELPRQLQKQVIFEQAALLKSKNKLYQEYKADQVGAKGNSKDNVIINYSSDESENPANESVQINRDKDGTATIQEGDKKLKNEKQSRQCALGIKCKEHDHDSNKVKESTTAFRFRQYKEQFKNMTRRTKVNTKYSIQGFLFQRQEHSMIGFLSQEQDKIYHIREYDLNTGSSRLVKTVSGNYVKCEEVVGNIDGTKFALSYFDSGVYKLYMFDNHNQEILHIENVNDLLGIDYRSQPPKSLPNPMIHVEFLFNDIIFVNLYQTTKQKNWYFFYCLKDKQIIGKARYYQMDCSSQNFPMDTFNNQQNKEIYCLYRYGECITISYPDIYKLNNYEEQKNALVDQSYFNNIRIKKLYNCLSKAIFSKNLQILIMRSSKKVIFFKRVVQGHEDDCRLKDWDIYYILKQSGQIFYIDEANKLIVTQEQKIYEYIINRETLIPEMISVMFNSMRCTNLVSDTHQDYYIPYSEGQSFFFIYERNSFHNFKVTYDHSSKEGNKTINLIGLGQFLICDKSQIYFYKIQTSQLVHKQQVLDQNKDKLLENTLPSNEIDLGAKIDKLMNKKIEAAFIEVILPQILKVTVNRKEDRLALLIGKENHNYTYNITSIIIYEIIEQNTMPMEDHKVIYKRELPQEFDDLSVNFEFCRDNDDCVYFVDQFIIYRYNYVKDEFTIKRRFKYQLCWTPEQLLFNENQTKVLISAQDDVIFIDFKTDQEYDIDMLFEISHVKACVQCEGIFYVLANKCQKTKGLFLFSFKESNPADKQYHKTFILKWRNSLEIDDANLFIMKECPQKLKPLRTNNLGASSFQRQTMEEEDHSHQKLVVCYKAIYINTFTIFVIKLNDTCQVAFRHESFHIWESLISSNLLPTRFFLILSKEGATQISLSSAHDHKLFLTDKNQDVVLHSLSECNFLKLGSSNHLLFQYDPDNNHIIVKVEDYYERTKYNDTAFFNIYQIIIQELTLQQLMLIQGLFSCSNQSEIAKLIEEQPQPAIFYKSFLEIEINNLVSILGFDSRSIKALLNEKHCENFPSKYPIFYKVRHQDASGVSYRSALDTAIENNQIIALNMMIDYIIKYQNNFAYSFLFETNFTTLLKKGINVVKLLTSDIFCHQFDFEEWPQTHVDNSEMIMPYNGSIFKLRNQYVNIFGDDGDESTVQDVDDEDQMIYKIKYTLNQLPNMGTESSDLMNMLAATDYLDILQTDVVKGLASFKWHCYAKRLHYFGSFVHFMYVFTFFAYINIVYIDDNYTNKNALLCAMLICHFYAFIYDFKQLMKSGIEYFEDPWNYFDLSHIVNGFINLYLQFQNTEYKKDGMQLYQTFMILTTISLLIKTFFFLRIFFSLTKLVIMMKNVMSDLRIFMLFHMIFIVMLSVILDILGYGNCRADDVSCNEAKDASPFYSGFEYEKLTPFFANIFETIRYSLGDFNFEQTQYMNDYEIVMFWVVWLVIILMTCIIFLNFIIAEVSDIYARVNSQVEELILQERAQLIDESEVMIGNTLQSNLNMFPKYIIMREVEY